MIVPDGGGVDLDAAVFVVEQGEPEDPVVVTRRWLAEVVREIRAHRAARCAPTLDFGEQS